MRRAAAALVAAVGIAAVGACTIDVSLEGKRCPCADGWQCDPVTDTCARSVCNARVASVDFTSAWATPNQVLWTWQAEGEAADFLRYELVVAESEADLASRGGTARVFDTTTNAELGAPTSAALTRGLDPQTTYYAQLVAFDIDQCAHTSSVSARTTRGDAQGRVEIFVDELLAGGDPRPSGVAELVQAGGGAQLEYVPALDAECNPDDAVRPVCGQPFGVTGMALEVSHDPAQPQVDRLTGASFGDAFLELELASDAPIDTLCHVVRVGLGSCDAGLCFGYGSFVLPASGEPELLQIPLTAMTTEGDVPLAYADLDVLAGGAPIVELALSCDWHRDGTYRVDDVVLRH